MIWFLDISANLAVEISAMATTSDKNAMDESTDQSFNLDISLMHSSGKKKNRDGLATERLISVTISISSLIKIICNIFIVATNWRGTSSK